VHPDDDALVEGLRRNEPAAFDAAYARHGGRLYRFLHRLTGRRDLAEDLFQETWISVARSAARLEPDTDLTAWLFTVARNRYRSYRRWAVLDLTRLAALADEPRAAPPPGPDALAETRASADALERAIGRISAAHREVLLLAAVEGLEPAQIAAVLGERPETVRQRLHRARAELAAKLEREDASVSPRGEPPRRDLKGESR
jgi:RNA polymerase sigma-70 factor, ECF subfamily